MDSATTTRSPGFRLIYAGSIYGEQELELFLEGLRTVLRRRPEFQDSLRVEFVGWLSRHNQGIADQAIQSEDLTGILSFVGFRPRKEALRRIASADAGLLILANEPAKGVFVPAKLFDYLALDRQVLAAVPPGEVDELLHNLEWGVVVRPDPEAIAIGIEQIVDAPKPDRHADPDGRFDRRRLAAELAALLDDLVKARPRHEQSVEPDAVADA